MKNIKKWWEVASTQEEVELFTCLARNPKYSWRNISSIANELQWTSDKILRILKPYFDSKMIFIKKTEKGTSIAYWERLEEHEIDEQFYSPHKEQRSVRKLSRKK